ncbi:hypothetical protein L1887_37219 [Cichorium endivia]|nr:hypothetical protein L1887_37219 [Cichorium endivia]
MTNSTAVDHRRPGAGPKNRICRNRLALKREYHSPRMYIVVSFTVKSFMRMVQVHSPRMVQVTLKQNEGELSRVALHRGSSEKRCIWNSRRWEGWETSREGSLQNLVDDVRETGRDGSRVASGI